MANTVLNIAWLMFAFIQFCDTEKQSLNHYKLDDLCRKTAVDRRAENVTSDMLELFNSVSRYKWKMDCRITVKAPPDHRVLLKFANESMRPESSLFCIDYALIYNKTHAEHGQDPDPPYKMNLCGDGPTNKTFMSVGREMRLHVHSHSNPFATRVRSNGNPSAKHEGYKLFLASFHAGACQAGEIKCPSGNCMDGLVDCIHFNKSGDEPGKQSVLFVALSGAVISIFFLCLIIGCVYFCEPEEEDGKGDEILQRESSITKRSSI